ncbi:MAG TPA: hypothetical protein VGB63_02000 [Pedobacter sp.]|jgi:hypothetical protein
MDIIFSAGTYLHDLFISRLSSFPVYIIAALFIMLFCVISIVELITYLIIGRVNSFYIRKRDADIEDRIITMLANVVVFGDDDVNPKAVVAHFMPRFGRLPIYRESIRKILVAKLLNNNSNFSGRTAEILRELYFQLKLDKHARKSLRSKPWCDQIEAIRELTEMSVKDECAIILKHTNDRNPQLRLEAQVAYIRLCSDNPFRFLDTIREPLLEYHQIILFEVITKAETMARPRFSFWLNSKNDSVVLFSLKLVEYYQQFDALPTLIYLINHYNHIIRGYSIDLLGRMEAEMAESHLVASYPIQPLKIKIKILHTLGLIASGSSLSFLNSQARNKEYPIRIAALRAIKAHRQDGPDLLTALFNEGAGQDKAIIRHVLDERIKV